MISTNQIFLQKALSVLPIFEACVRDLICNAKLSLLNVENSILFNSKQSCIRQTITYSSHTRNIHKQPLTINYESEIFAGSFLSVKFESEAEFYDLIRNIPIQYLMPIFVITLRSDTIPPFQTKTAIVEGLGRMINYLLKYTPNVWRIKFENVENLAQMPIVFDGAIVEHDYLLNLFELISILKLNKRITNITISLNNDIGYEEHFQHLVTNIITFENCLLKKHKNVKVCEIKLDAQDPVGISDFMIGLFHIFHNHTISNTFVFNIKCYFCTLKEILFYQRQFKENGRESSFKINYLSPQEGDFLRTHLKRLIKLGYDDIHCLLPNFLNSLSKPDCLNNYSKNLKNIKRLDLDRSGHILFHYPDQFEEWKARLSVFANLKELAIRTFSHQSQKLDVRGKTIKIILNLISAFPSTLEVLSISSTHRLNDCNTVLSQAYPNLKLFKLIYYNSKPVNYQGTLSHYGNIPSDYFMAFKNLQVLRLNCIKILDLLFPPSLRILEINCIPCTLWTFPRLFRPIQPTVEDLKKALHEEISDNKCKCNALGDSFKQCIMRRGINNRRTFIYLANISDLLLYNKLFEHKTIKYGKQQDINYYGYIF
uniref:F-box domain-containing protein n=1 Tax=Rhabditophanes sp. KR3021 TaxID=114890 RepID=A0AC35TNB4_9BILA